MLLAHIRPLGEVAARPAFVPKGYIGPVGVGLPNLTQNVRPPVRPNPEDEQGVGRAPGMRWESREHPIYDNPDYYLGTPPVYQAYALHEGDRPLHQVPASARAGYIMEFDFYQQTQLQNNPGGLSGFGDTTVPGRPSISNTLVRTLGP